MTPDDEKTVMVAASIQADEKMAMLRRRLRWSIIHLVFIVTVFIAFFTFFALSFNYDWANTVVLTYASTIVISSINSFLERKSLP